LIVDKITKEIEKQEGILNLFVMNKARSF